MIDRRSSPLARGFLGLVIVAMVVVSLPFWPTLWRFVTLEHVSLEFSSLMRTRSPLSWGFSSRTWRTATGGRASLVTPRWTGPSGQEAVGRTQVSFAYEQIQHDMEEEPRCFPR